jgi:hypothetical protein
MLVGYQTKMGQQRGQILRHKLLLLLQMQKVVVHLEPTLHPI